MSLDFLVLNICGFVFYAIYSTIGFFTDIKGAGTVVLGDLIFAYHALVMVLIWLVQAVIYPKGKNRLSRRTLIICIGLWGFVGAQFFLTTICKFKTYSVNIIPWTEYFNPVSSLGYGKLILTVIKYIPVAYWNYVRQSTFGWSICGVLCDFSGGFISLISGILSTEKGFNMSKLGLGLISIAYDLLFVIQHYCFYHENTTE
jgi:cystinosin